MSTITLDMYDFPEIKGQTDVWHKTLSGMAGEQIKPFSDITVNSERKTDKSTIELGTSNELLLGQTCGLPLIENPNSFRVVGIPMYSAPNCTGYFYRSYIIVQQSMPYYSLHDFKDRPFSIAVNSRCSLSGNLLLAATLGRDLLKQCSDNITYTGSHEASIVAVREGRADMAAIDCVSYHLLLKNRPRHLIGVAVIGHSMEAPALPYVTSHAASDEIVDALRCSLRTAVAECDPAVLGALHLTGFKTDSDGFDKMIERLRRLEEKQLAEQKDQLKNHSSGEEQPVQESAVTQEDVSSQCNFVQLYAAYVRYLRRQAELPSKYELHYTKRDVKLNI